MSNFDLEYLLGGYATNTLTEEERHALLKASLVNQRLFDLLADEEALKELLDDPAVRRRLLQQLKEPEEPGWFTPTLAWLTRTETLAIAGSLAAVTLATVFGLRFWEQSRELLKQDQNRPGLSETLKEPTVRSKLPSKPSAPSQAQPPATPPPAGAPTQAATPGATSSPPPEAMERRAKLEERSRSDKMLQDASPVQRQERRAASPAGRSGDAPRATAGSETDAPPAQPFATPQTSPPVVLPKAPAQNRPVQGKAGPPTANRPPQAEAATSSERAKAPGGPQPHKDTPEGPPPSDEALSKPDSQTPALPPPPAMNKRATVKPQLTPTPPQAPGISARALFIGEEPKEAASPQKEARKDSGTASAGDAASDVQSSDAMERLSNAGRLDEPVGEASQNATAKDTGEEARRPPPLGIRVHHRRLPLQGMLGDQTPEGLALPQLFVEVNQSGYLYVLTQDASGAWTVGAPAASLRSSAPATSAVQKATSYQILLVDEAGSSPVHKTYVLFSRTPLYPLEQALEFTPGRSNSAETVEETNEFLAGLLRAFAAHPLVIEEVAEAAAGKKAGPVTYVADAVQPSRTEILYRIPPRP